VVGARDDPTGTLVRFGTEMKSRLKTEFDKLAKITTFKAAKDYVAKNKNQGDSDDVKISFQPFIEPKMEFCTTVYKHGRKPSHVIDALN